MYKDKKVKKIKAREYYENNRDKIIEKQKEYYQNNKDKVKEKTKKHYEKNKDKALEYAKIYSKKYYEKNKEKRLTQSKVWQNENKDKRNKYVKGWVIQRKYGITLEQYNDKLESQQGLCSICGELGTALDHCHTTGKIRDFLCNRCNLALGNMNDDIELLQKMINYLIRHK